jgi:uncharacterized protein YukE
VLDEGDAMTLHVRPAVLGTTAESFASAAKEIRSQGTALEGSCESVPKVGDVQAALVFGQAHYDWAQTRFEDLAASAEDLVEVSQLLKKSGEAFAAQDQQTRQTINNILSALSGGVA